MSTLQDLLELEARSSAAGDYRGVGAALELAISGWSRGERSRELALHLMFLAWYAILEPPFLTGFDERRVPSAQLDALFCEAHDVVLPAGAQSDDVEALYVAGLMAALGLYATTDEERAWQRRSRAYRERYRALAPDGLAPAVFEGRGLYGRYFAGQCRVANGY